MNRRPLAILVAAVVAAVLVVVVLVVTGSGDDGPNDDGGPTSSSAGADGPDDDNDDSTTTGAGPEETAVDDTTVDDPGSTPLGPERDPVPLDAETDFGDGVGIRLRAIEAVEVEGRLPGERSGRGVVVTVEMTNTTGEPVSVDRVTVDLVDGSGASATPIDDPDRAPLSGMLAPGATATGEYVYELPADQRDGISIRVTYAADRPIVIFRGDAPPPT